ncbi:protein AF1q isoform X2 [Synchiropus splendidus]|uniref:protein AF1q isoform X2 n=1 Tax=Synchiropus splendidus TaxID=270530 RepID=UPI00237D903E|nr:protein AF1q isoform X2 [Synchiropus splendidus]
MVYRVAHFHRHREKVLAENRHFFLRLVQYPPAAAETGLEPRSTKDHRTNQSTMERSSSQYDSFLFWRQPIAELDLSELEDLGLIAPASSSSKAKEEKSSLRTSEEDELAEFTSFNYWRAPIADVDALLADLNLLL